MVNPMGRRRSPPMDRWERTVISGLPASWARLPVRAPGAAPRVAGRSPGSAARWPAARQPAASKEERPARGKRFESEDLTRRPAGSRFEDRFALSMVRNREAPNHRTQASRYQRLHSSHFPPAYPMLPPGRPISGYFDDFSIVQHFLMILLRFDGPGNRKGRVCRNCVPIFGAK